MVGDRNDALFWSGRMVGVILNSKTDMFDLYGSWTPTADTDLYRQFLEQAGMEGGARVEIGKIGSGHFGRVELYPDDHISDEINVKIGPAE